MNELIKVVYDNDQPTVSGRDLHEFLEVKTAYKDWFPRMVEYGFTDGVDFCSILSESTGRPPGYRSPTHNRHGERTLHDPAQREGKTG